MRCALDFAGCRDSFGAAKMGEGKEGNEDCYFEREGKASSAAESKCADDGSDLHERFQVVEMKIVERRNQSLSERGCAARQGYLWLL